MSLKTCCLVVVSCLPVLSGCSQTSIEPADVAANASTAAVFNTAGAPTVEFSVPDMMCPQSCAPAVKEILSKQPGVQDVLVDFEAKKATVAIEEGPFDADQAIAALVDKGFDHSARASQGAAANPQAALR